jgi:hypothetical protein
VCHVVRTEDLTSEEAGFKVEKFMLGSGLIDFYALLGVMGAKERQCSVQWDRP